jgi:Porin subfamily
MAMDAGRPYEARASVCLHETLKQLCLFNRIGFLIPGTQTCLRGTGFARFEYQVGSTRAWSADSTGFRSLGRLNIDARTRTSRRGRDPDRRVDFSGKSNADHARQGVHPVRWI